MCARVCGIIRFDIWYVYVMCKNGEKYPMPSFYKFSPGKKTDKPSWL